MYCSSLGLLEAAGSDVSEVGGGNGTADFPSASSRLELHHVGERASQPRSLASPPRAEIAHLSHLRFPGKRHENAYTLTHLRHLRRLSLVGWKHV